MTPGEKFAQRLLSVDWSYVVLRACALRRCKVATLARHLSTDAQHLNRLARGDVREPSSFRLAFALLDEIA